MALYFIVGFYYSLRCPCKEKEGQRGNHADAVVDRESGRVEFFNQRCEYLGEWRSRPEELLKTSTLHFSGVSSDHDGRLYLTGTKNNVVIRLKPQNIESPHYHFKTPTQTNAVAPYGGQGYPVR